MEGGTTVITGGDQPLGGAIARRLVDRVDTLVLGGREADRLEALVADLEAVACHQLRTDPRDEYDLERLMELASRVGDGSIDLVLPCARVHHDGSGTVLGGSYAGVDDELRTNVRGVYATIREAAPHLADGARVIVPVEGDDGTDGIFPVGEVAIAALVAAIAEEESWAMAPVNVGRLPLTPDASVDRAADILLGAIDLEPTSLVGQTLAADDVNVD